MQPQTLVLVGGAEDDADHHGPWSSVPHCGFAEFFSRPPLRVLIAR
jgi:hypothetical protein